MVLRGRPRGRVGHRRTFLPKKADPLGRLFLFLPASATVKGGLTGRVGPLTSTRGHPTPTSTPQPQTPPQDHHPGPPPGPTIPRPPPRDSSCGQPPRGPSLRLPHRGPRESLPQNSFEPHLCLLVAPTPALSGRAIALARRIPGVRRGGIPRLHFGVSIPGRGACVGAGKKILEGIFIAEEKHSYSSLFLHDLLLSEDNSKKRSWVVMPARYRPTPRKPPLYRAGPFEARLARLAVRDLACRQYRCDGRE